MPDRKARHAGAWRCTTRAIGIAREDLPRLFRDFQQLDTGHDKQHEGTGLGLALTRRLVEAQGGSVGVSSEPGQGSTFFLVLDRARPGGELQMLASQAPPERRVLLLHSQNAEHAEQQQLQRGLGAAGFEVHAAGDSHAAVQRDGAQPFDAIALDLELPEGDRLALFAVHDVLFKPLRSAQVGSALARLAERQPEPARVLVIDDDPLALSLMHATLAGLGISALCVADARQALRDIDQLKPDALVLDLMMPGFDGFAVLHALQGLPAWRGLPVYIWTSLLLSDEELRLLRRSAQAILHKGGGSVQPPMDRLRQAGQVAVSHKEP